MQYFHVFKKFACKFILVFLCFQSVFVPVPANAVVSALVPIAVGAVLSLTMVAGAGVYKPAVFSQANIAVDSLTGDITSKVIVAKTFLDGSAAGFRGFSSQYVLDFAKASQWIKDHIPDYPLLSSALNNATTYSAPVVGNVVLPHGSTNKISISLYRNLLLSNVSRSYASNYGQGSHYLLSESGAYYSIDFVEPDSNNPSNGIYNIYQFFGSVTNNPETIRPGVISPGELATIYPKSQAAQDETNKIAIDYPASIKTLPPGITSQQLAEAGVQSAADLQKNNAAIAQSLANAHPDIVQLQSDANTSQALADQLAIQAEMAQTELETIEPEVVTPPLPGAVSIPALPTIPAVDDFSFTPPIVVAMTELSVNLATHEPFASFSTLPSLLTAMTATPVAPVFDLGLPFVGTYHIDLSGWDGAAALLRAGLSVFAMIGAVYFVIRVWV